MSLDAYQIEKNPSYHWLKSAKESLPGIWKNVDPKTRGIPQIDIIPKDGELSIRFWGAMLPKNQPFGPPVKLTPVAKSKSLGDKDNYECIAFAIFESRFSKEYFTIKYKDETVTLESITIYTDGSERLPRFDVCQFKKRP